MPATIMSDGFKEVGFVISRISSFIPSEAIKYKAEEGSFEKSFIFTSSEENEGSIINNTRYYAKAYATYTTGSTFYSYKSKDIIVGELPEKISKGEIKTLDKTEDDPNTILKGHITSFGKPVSTEHGFLFAKNESFTGYSLVFNSDNKTTYKKIKIILITADVAGNIEYSSQPGKGNYKYKAWIRNSSGVKYGEMKEFTK